MEAKSETNKPISNFLFILWAGGTALLSYSLVYALRKPFTAATFDGMDFFGMDYKVATTIMQIFGYLISKFFAIKIVSELKRENRLKFMIFWSFSDCSPLLSMYLHCSSTDWHWGVCGELSSVSLRAAK